MIQPFPVYCNGIVGHLNWIYYSLPTIGNKCRNFHSSFQTLINIFGDTFANFTRNRKLLRFYKSFFFFLLPRAIVCEIFTMMWPLAYAKYLHARYTYNKGSKNIMPKSRYRYTLRIRN